MLIDADITKIMNYFQLLIYYNSLCGVCVLGVE